MALAIITKDNIESQAYDNITYFLDTRSIIGDPRDPSGTRKRKFIYDYDPLMKSLNFGDFPYIIAEHPRLEYSKTSTDGRTKDIAWSMVVTVRVARDGAGQGLSGRGKTDLFSIGDDLQSFSNNMTYRKQLQGVNVYFLDLKKVNYSTPVISQKYLYEVDYELNFMTRIQVSS